MERRCFWTDPTYTAGKPLEGKDSAKVLIVGGGVAGLFTAHFLDILGIEDIVILEKKDVGSGLSAHSAGMFVGEEIETAAWPTLVDDIGMELAKLYIEAHFDGQKEALRIMRESGFECDFVEHDLVLLNSSGDERLAKELRLRKELGSEFMLLNEPRALPDGSRDVYQARAFIERMASFNPMKFFHGIGTSLRRRGIRIHEQTPFRSMEGNVAKTDSGEVHFEKIVFARGLFEKHPSLMTYLTSVCVTAPLSSRSRQYLKDERKEMFLSSLLNEYPTFHYGTVTADGRLLVGYGDKPFDTDTLEVEPVDEHIASIEAFIRDFLDEPVATEYAWSAAYPLSKGSLPYLAVQDNVFAMAGAGTQVTNVVLASYVAHVIVGRTHALDAIFSRPDSLCQSAVTHK